jgi:deazaflavin-dependent oxidoreductase (nitroreductase family)
VRQPFHMTAGLRAVSAIVSTLLRLGMPVGPSVLLAVTGRRSGKIYSMPVALVEDSGTRWLVAAFGEVNWVRNLRAAGQAKLTRGRRTEAIGVVELVPREAAPILKQFLKASQRVSFIKPYFQVTPQSSLADFDQEALYHPVFRVVSASGKERRTA